MALNVNFRGDMEPFEVFEDKVETAPETETDKIARLLAERDEAWRNQLLQVSSNSDRKISELYEQNQTAISAMTQHLASNKPEPDYNDSNSYFQQSKTEPHYLTADEARKLAREEADRVLQQRVSEGSKKQQATEQREREISSYFEDKMKDLHPYRDKIVEAYKMAKENFPTASVDEQFNYAIHVVKNFSVQPTRQQGQNRSPVGTGGNANYQQYQHPNYGQQAFNGAPSDQHREMLRNNEESTIKAYAEEMREYKDRLSKAFDAF